MMKENFRILKRVVAALFTGVLLFPAIQASAQDVGVTALLSPVSTGCHSTTETVRVRLRNFDAAAIDFSVTPVTINVSVSGPNAQVFPPLVISAGTLPASSNLDTVIFIGYDMSAAGTYTFNAASVLAGDVNAGNDALVPVVINYTAAGTASATPDEFCAGNGTPITTLTLTGAAGSSMQWQHFNPGTGLWVNEPGGTSSPFMTSPQFDTTIYRALVCGVSSALDTVFILTTPAPAASGVTRCGPGTAMLNATGTGNLSWYDAATGGNLLQSGPSFTTPVLTSNSTFYVAASTGSSLSSVGPAATASTSGYTLEAGLFFDVLSSSITIQGVNIYPLGTGPGVVNIAVLDASAQVVQSIAFNTTGTTPAVQTYVPLNFTVPQGTGYSLVMMSRTGGVSSLLRDLSATTVGGYPFTLPGKISITNGRCCPIASSTAYYYFYDWKIIDGCASARTPVTVTLTPSDTIIASATVNPVCGGGASSLSVTSTNPDYVYSWSPAAGLNTTTGNNVSFVSDSSITYTVHAIDNVTGCESLTYLPVSVVPAPLITVTPSDTTVCFGEDVQFGSFAIITDTVYTAGTGTLTNSATLTTTAGPYGGVNGGNKQQYLVTASELTALGLTAGPINSVGFDVAALNSVDTLRNYTIRMGATSLLSLTAAFIPNVPVVSSMSYYLPVLGWNTHYITPFMWDGTSSIVVQICFNNNDPGYASGNASVRYTSTTGGMTYFGQDNNPNICVYTGGTVSANRPNIQFRRSAPASYSWTPSAGLSNAAIGNPVLTASVTNDYVLTLTDLITNCSAKDTVSVIVNPAPQVNIGADTAICSGNQGFIADASGPGFSYVWHDGSTAPTYFINQTGVYSVTATNANGCSRADTLIVSEAIPAQITIQVNLLSPSSAELTASSGFTNYLWSTLETTQTITVNNSGTYTVTATDLNGCTSTIHTNVIFTLGLNEDGSEATVSYFPNPSDGIFNMNVNGFKGGNMIIEIMDLNGKVVYNRQLKNAAGSFTEQIDISNMAEGTYIIKLSSGDSVSVQRLIIARR